MGQSSSKSIRPAAVAGQFYPGDAEALAAAVQGYLAAVKDTGQAPKAMIVPHAGYIYSGPVAASAYARIGDARGEIRRVVLVGPAHRMWFRGVAASGVEAFATPLGEVPVDRETVTRIIELPQMSINDEAHKLEHSLEVQLPFLIETLDDFSIVPLVVGDAEVQEVAAVLEALWDGPETLIVISSDLSHYHDYETARRMDAATSQAIERLRPGDIGDEQACGRGGIRGLLTVASERGMRAETIDLRNSGDTAGARDQVVGYGAYVFS